MEYRQFGKTDLMVSQVGFGAWAIGGPAMAGDIPIGWGKVDDRQSVAALKKALDRGINFFDTADVYGIGHSEELIGKTFGNRQDVIIASKVGNKVDETGLFTTDYHKEYIQRACEKSLKRLKRDTIDYYQLHTARMADLENGDCIEAMEQLQQEGKIRYWGLSLNTFHPEPEADFLMERALGSGFQIVFNLINQRGLPMIQKAYAAGYGIIARMPLQFGLLTGKFDRNSRFDKDDHRFFRLTPEFLAQSLDVLDDMWETADKDHFSKTTLALSYILGYQEVSTVIPGIRTPEQARQNTSGIVPLPKADLDFMEQFFKEKLYKLVERMEEIG